MVAANADRDGADAAMEVGEAPAQGLDVRRASAMRLLSAVSRKRSWTFATTSTRLTADAIAICTAGSLSSEQRALRAPCSDRQRALPIAYASQAALAAPRHFVSLSGRTRIGLNSVSTSFTPLQRGQTKRCKIVLADDWRTSVDMIHIISTLQFTQAGGSKPASESFRRSTTRAEPLSATIARPRQAFVSFGTEGGAVGSKLTAIQSCARRRERGILLVVGGAVGRTEEPSRCWKPTICW
ncbi:hypothetical protein AB7M15_006547 [Bradyrhizobium ottawaense]